MPSFERNFGARTEEKKKKVKKPGKFERLVKTAGLVLGLGSAAGLTGATLEGLRNRPQDKAEISVEKKNERQQEGKKIESDDEESEILHGKDDKSIGELRRFIAGANEKIAANNQAIESEDDEEWKEDKEEWERIHATDPFAPKAEKYEEPEYIMTSVKEDDLENAHVKNLFEKVLGEKYRLGWSEKNRSGDVRFSVVGKEGTFPTCYISIDEEGKYTISGIGGQPWKTVDESELENELDNLTKKMEEGQKKDPFYSPFA